MRIDSECDYCDAIKTEIICNVCGKEFDTWDRQETFQIHKEVGYGSVFDEARIDLDLCCSCFDEILTEYVLPICKINPIKEQDGDPDHVSAALARSMRESIIRKNPLAAKEFLSRLSMYDENGQLKRE